MRERFVRFMYGRYGMDSLGKFTIITGVAAMLLAGWNNSMTLSLLSWACIIYSYFRMFSRNVYKRASKNQWFLGRTNKLRSAYYRQKNLMAQRRTHHIYKCPACRQKIRIPRGKGRIEIRCPKCNTTFIKNS